MKPMLATTLERVEDAVFPKLASPKLDGVRAIVVDGVVLSRSLKPIPNRHVQALFGCVLFDGLDGELIVGEPTHPDCYRTTVSGVMSEDGEPDVRFYVFDDFTHPTWGFAARLEYAALKLGVGMVLVPHPSVSDEEGLSTLESRWLEEGYEGVMLRALDGPYKYGRSTVREGWLLKVKRFMDSEAVIAGCYEQMYNGNEATTNALGYTERSTHKANKFGKDTLGGLHVRDLTTGVEFDIGTGFDNATRDALWAQHLANPDEISRNPLVGKVVKYRYFPSGSKEKPRFPTWVGFRDERDM